MYLELYLNGEKLGNVTESTHTYDKWPSNGVFIIGQSQEKLGAGFEKFQSLSGEITGIEMWDQILDSSTIKRISDCQSNYQGNILSWINTNWTVHGQVNTSIIPLNELCVENKDKNFIMIPQQQPMDFSIKICKKLGGELILPQSNGENELISSISAPYADICDFEGEGGKAVWLRLMPNQKGRWKDSKTDQAPPFDNWRQGKNSETDDNCAFMLSGDSSIDGKWSSTTCSAQSPRTLCTMCQFLSSYNRFSLRGLCSDSKHDSIFFLERNPGQMPYFKGLSSSVISWDTERQSWTLKHLRYATPGYLAEDAIVSLKKTDA